MSRIRARDTKPEMLVRRLAHRLGYRYRLHRRDLPGKPDIAFSSRCKVVFVHGCFWHGHDCRRGQHTPKTNVDYWTRKLETNRMRDARTLDRLIEIGWDALVLWECELRDQELAARLVKFLGPPRSPT